jgi:hypothetical protein
MYAVASKLFSTEAKHHFWQHSIHIVAQNISVSHHARFPATQSLK